MSAPAIAGVVPSEQSLACELSGMHAILEPVFARALRVVAGRASHRVIQRVCDVGVVNGQRIAIGHGFPQSGYAVSKNKSTVPSCVPLWYRYLSP